MNPHILNTEVQEFINDNLDSDLINLILKGTSFPDIDSKELVEQIESKNKCKKKLPTWYNHQNIYFPNKLNIEQTSSEVTAQFKSSLVEGDCIIDLTGGFGVDCFYFSKQFNTIIHCEINEELSQIVEYNFAQFDIHNIQFHAIDGIKFLKNSDKTYDWIYVDPSRRHDVKGKVFFLKDCLPDIPKALNQLFRHSNNIMIKTSPLLDISVGINELKHVKTIHVVAVNNEVKELIWILENNFDSEATIQAVNITPGKTDKFDFKISDERDDVASYSLPLSYLYEPNSAILKAGAFNSLALKLGVYKLHKHSHLYTSNQLMEFPGRRFKVETVLPYNKKLLLQANIKKANITTRNFPETVEQIRKIYKIKDGGDVYLFFTINSMEEKTVIIVSKIS